MDWRPEVFNLYTLKVDELWSILPHIAVFDPKSVRLSAFYNIVFFLGQPPVNDHLILLLYVSPHVPQDAKLIKAVREAKHSAIIFFPVLEEKPHLIDRTLFDENQPLPSLAVLKSE